MPKLARQQRLGSKHYVIIDGIADGERRNGHMLLARVGVHGSFASDRSAQVLNAFRPGSHGTPVGLLDTHGPNLDFFVGCVVVEPKWAGLLQTGRGQHPDPSVNLGGAGTVIFITKVAMYEFVHYRLSGKLSGGVLASGGLCRGVFGVR